MQKWLPQVLADPPGLWITYFNPHFSPEEPATTICARLNSSRVWIKGCNTKSAPTLPCRYLPAMSWLFGQLEISHIVIFHDLTKSPRCRSLRLTYCNLMLFPFVCMYGTIPAYTSGCRVHVSLSCSTLYGPCPYQPSVPGSMGAFFYFENISCIWEGDQLW